MKSKAVMTVAGIEGVSKRAKWPRRLGEMHQFLGEFKAERGRWPTLSEIAEHLGIANTVVTELVKMGRYAGCCDCGLVEPMGKTKMVWVVDPDWYLGKWEIDPRGGERSAAAVHAVRYMAGVASALAYDNLDVSLYEGRGKANVNG